VTPRDATTAFARAIVDEWVRCGMTDAVIAPGSRSTPLALAMATCDHLRVHVHIDERSAAGFALGLGRASARPAALVCTSGTAAALFHSAVLEARHGRVPLIVCTADRPAELHEVGAGQTIEQRDLFGDAPRWSHDPGPPDDTPGAGARWRQLASRAFVVALGPPCGPVHLNLPFREPLVPSGAPLVDAPGRADGAPWVATWRGTSPPSEALARELAQFVCSRRRGVVVAGWGAGVIPATAERFAEAARWPLFADPLSGLRTGGCAVSTYDAVLRVPVYGEERRPDGVLRLGAPPTSKLLAAWAGPEIPTWLVDPDEVWLDPVRGAWTRVVCDPEALLTAAASFLDVEPPSDRAWADEWRSTERRARAALDAFCDADDEPFEGRIARDVLSALPDGATLVVASSMPVRDIEAFAAPRRGVDLIANRGVNGIDGFVSTALGVAAARRGAPVVALLGDLCFLHDANGLLGAAARGIDAVLVVVDNDGGGIFSFLPQAESVAVTADDFEAVFGTPHGVDLGALAAVHGVGCRSVRRAGDLHAELRAAIAEPGISIVLVATDRRANVVRHRAVWEAVSAALR
jgi:2-succinyl-5-enolpyruvyl-6-hydroxy-3-cyclohexene-1-carboxylate synthase